MNINSLLDRNIQVEGDDLPTVRQIIDRYFIEKTAGNVTLGKMAAAQYIAYLTGTTETSEADTSAGNRQKPYQANGSPHADNMRATGEPSASSNSSMSSDAEAVLASLGIPVSTDGRIDLLGAFAGALTPEGAKTPLGAVFGTVVRGLGDAKKPRT
ncbi:hypothetical protein [Sphingomonas sp. 3-13AW]|uniref:hypothetical protein n=1 Tax=Sphingomonas sp. 3-13AW TaxID=3050450 RepID=UPI003BB577CE